ncbi:hypothetical protein N9E11_01055 [Crocinitomicaceae bacterium]|nr:hypothetical protein [Crocinitomicaceae bacterium]
MMEPNVTYLEINSLDIWEFERDLFFSDNGSIKRVENVESKLIDLIIRCHDRQIKDKNNQKIESITDLKKLDSGDHSSGYYERYVRNWRTGLGDKRERIAISIFQMQDAFYSLYQNIDVELSEETFDYWFTLKLSQFDFGVKHIADFLDYQLKTTFNSDVKKFHEFLDLLLLQYSNDILSDRVREVLGKWKNIEPPNNAVDSSSTPELSEIEREYVGDFRTFVMKKVDSDLRYFKREENETALNAFWNELIHGGFIQKPSIEHLEAIFKPGKIKKENRLIWKRSIKTLSEFVKKIMETNTIVELDGVDHWLVTIDCFVLRNSKEIKFESIYKPQNEASKLKGEIESIVEEFISNLE